MIVGVRWLLEYLPRLVGEKHFVALVVHEPSKLVGKRPDRKKIVLHPVDKSVGGDARVARQRCVADEIGPSRHSSMVGLPAMASVACVAQQTKKPKASRRIMVSLPVMASLRRTRAAAM
jgi:hypothetical protein